MHLCFKHLPSRAHVFSVCVFMFTSMVYSHTNLQIDKCEFANVYCIYFCVGVSVQPFSKKQFLCMNSNHYCPLLYDGHIMNEKKETIPGNE